MDYILQIILVGLSIGSIYAIVGISYNLIYSTSNIINFSQGEFIGAGALFCMTFLTAVQMPLIISLVLTCIVVGILSVVLERVAYRPVINKNDSTNIGWIISTLAFGTIINASAMLIWGKEYLPFPKLFPNISLSIGSSSIDFNQLMTIISVLAIALLVDLFLNKTNIGLAIKATTFSRGTAEYMGINTVNVILTCFLLAGITSAIGGILIAPFTYASIYMGFLIGIKGFAAAILGGLGSARGALIGGLVLGLCEQIGSTLVGEGYRDVIAFVILILVLVLRPQGIFGVKVYQKA